MPNIASVLKDEIRRLARREINAETKTMRKQVTRYRGEIAELKRRLSAAEREVVHLKKNHTKRAAAGAEVSDDAKLRFSAKGLASHRERLGLSAADYARLVGCSGLSIYHWEQGKSRPRQAQIAKIAQIRTLGKREAWKQLEEMDG